MTRSLLQILPAHRAILQMRVKVLRRVWGMDLGTDVRISFKANLDRTYPRGIHIGESTYVTFGVVVLTHDRTRGVFTDTYIGRNCFIGAHAIIMPGVTIGDGTVVGAGSIVTRDVPAGSVVAGNPAKVIRSGIEVGRHGRFANADEVTHRLIAEGKFVP